MQSFYSAQFKRAKPKCFFYRFFMEAERIIKMDFGYAICRYLFTIYIGLNKIHGELCVTNKIYKI